MRKDIVFLLDNGHGEDTPGKRSPVWSNGTQLLEYKYNREIVKLIAKRLKVLGIPYEILVPETRDVGLAERVKRAEAFKKLHGKVVLISIHANAGGGTGFEAWTYTGQSESDIVAEYIIEGMRKGFPAEAIRSDTSDGDADKETDLFYILKKTSCPAVLTESFFMDNEKDCMQMFTCLFREQVAASHVKGIQNYLENAK